MERSSSPWSTSSGPPAASASASTQPTYTTAGTIYNPNSSQPLQPPTRRGRSFKWASGIALSEMGLFPRSGLGALQLRPGVGLRGPTSVTRQHYTPLQQNYDRAISPISEPEHEVVRTPLQPPRLQPIYDMASAPMFPSINGSRLAESNDSDDDSDIGMDPLLNMTVKSLQNLASYPNPNQKRAQKALLRGARPNLGNPSAGVGRNTMNASPVSSKLPVFGSSEAWQDTGDETRGQLRHAMSDSFVLRRSEGDHRSRLYDGGRSATYSHVESRLSTPTPIHDDGAFNIPTSTALVSGPGAPKPLTAGPPGQRQYRPSTFESTFRALNPNFTSQEYTAHGDHRTLMGHLSQNTEPLPPLRTLSAHEYIDMVSRNHGQYIDYEKGLLYTPEAPVDECFMGIGHPTYMCSYTNVEALEQDDSLGNETNNWCHHFLTLTPSHEERVGWRPTDEALRERRNRINHYWYAGISIFGNAQTSVANMDVDEYPKSRKNIYGAIGDGRPEKKYQTATDNSQIWQRSGANGGDSSSKAAVSENSDESGGKASRESSANGRSLLMEDENDPTYPLMLLGKALQSIL